MKSLIPKGAKSTFVTSEKNMFLCASLYPRLLKTQNWIYNVFFFCSLYSDQKCILKVGGKLHNIVILTQFWSKMDLAPFGSRSSYCQLRARRALSLFNNVPLRSRRPLLLHKVYGDNALLVLNETSLNSINALLVVSQRYGIKYHYPPLQSLVQKYDISFV